MSLGTWGDMVFEVSASRVRTWTGMKRSGKARWAKLDVYLAKPVKQFEGPGLDALSLSVRLDVERGINPTDELKALREARDNGFVHPLIIGGELVFDCTLENIDEDHRRHDAQGRLLAATAELSFEEYA